MKIVSHDIVSKVKHTQHKTLQESHLEFSTYLETLPPKRDTELANISPPHFSRMFSFSAQIEAIIQHLLGSLQKNTYSEDVEVGITVLKRDHVSLFERYEESESIRVSNRGQIQTENETLDINLDFYMSRSFVVENRIDVYSQFDPLVINLDGEMPQLSSDTFSFDLDNDGESDQISKLKGKSGFLALDKNSDGIINQGSELFGTLTGDGFGELAEYDLDANNWIDENDAIFDKLQVWMRREESEEKELVALGEVGIGAIFLDSVNSTFTYKTESNSVLGNLKSSSFFLNENGSVGNISQIDLSAHQEDEPLAELLQV